MAPWFGACVFGNDGTAVKTKPFGQLRVVAQGFGCAYIAARTVLGGT